MAHSPRAKSSCWLKISTQHTKDAQVKWCSTQQCGPVKSNYGPVLNHMYQTRSLEVDQLLHMWHAGGNHWARTCKASFLFVLFSIAAKLCINFFVLLSLSGISYSTTERNSLMSTCGLSFELQRMAVAQRQNPRELEYGM